MPSERIEPLNDSPRHYRCPHCGRPSTSERIYDLGDGLIHIECPCGIAYTPDLALSEGEQPRRYVEIDDA